MEVVNNVSKIKPSKQSMTTVSIEDADESWALMLLNECGVDDEHINVQVQEFHNHKDDKGSCLKSINGQLEMNHSDQKSIAPKNEDMDEIDAEILSLTAIEIQKLELAEKQAALAAVQTQSKLNAEFFLMRIKALLRFDLLTLIR